MRRRARVGRRIAYWSHLMADTDDELHQFANDLGLRRDWHQHAGRTTAHYDITERLRTTAIAMGAVEVGYMSPEQIDILDRLRAAMAIAG
jgi:hypothetical protein